MHRIEIAVIALVLFAAPIVSAQGDDGANENATWGLCQAQEASQPGDDASNGSVSSTPPFSNTSDEECENAEDPWAGTPGGDHVPEDPGQPDDPGAPEDPGEDDNPGDDQGGDDHPDEDDNPGDDNRP